MEPTVHLINYARLLPETVLAAATFLIAASAAFRPNISRKFFEYAALLALIVTAILVGITGMGNIDGRLFLNEPAAQFFKLIFLSAAFFAIALISSSATENKTPVASQLCLLLLSVLAIMFLAMSSNLLSIFVSLEFSAIPLIAIAINHGYSEKAAAKFLTAALFSSLLILFGFSFLYGLSGVANLTMMKLQIAVVHITQLQIGVIILLAIAAILTGLMLKAGLIPFHAWAHALHQNLPVPVAAFLATAFSAVILLAFTKIFINGLFAFHGPEMNPNDWGRLVAFIAFVNIVLGTFQLVRQRDIVSFMFYAGITQIGFVLMGMISMVTHGLQSAGFYLVSFLFSATGVYAAVNLVKGKTNSTNLENLKGLAKTSMPLAVLLSIYLLSIAGLPLLAGFVAKYSVIAAALEMAGKDNSFHWMYLLSGAGIVCAIIALAQTCKIVHSFFLPAELPPVGFQFPVLLKIVLAVTALGTFFFGIYPDPLLSLAARISEAFGFISN